MWLTPGRRVAAVVVFVLLFAIGFLPLFGGPGYEQSLATGLVVPAAAALTVALEGFETSDLTPLEGFGRALATGGLLAAVAFATALLHGLRAGFCDFWEGSVLFALTGGFGAFMGAAWGSLVAEIHRGRKHRRLGRVLLALAGPAGGIVVSLVRFYASPMIFAYDPFFGYFSGTLYDTVVDVRPELWTYRAGSLSTLVAMALIYSALRRTADGRLHLVGAAPTVAARISLGIATLLASLTLVAAGPQLGHWQTSESIAQALGGRASGPRCDVIYPDSVAADQAALLVRDCEQELAADERTLGTHLDGRLTAFFFRDAEEKRRLMGAAETSIAKPWRRELYVQMAGYPHPLLGHEVAHVVAGSFGRGPFRIAGGLGGLWPNPGLIEGTAVATSPDDDALTDAQWARAMLDLGVLPPVHRLFSLGFLGENASKSYTVAGAFVAWIRDRWGAGAVRAWYGGASIERLTGKDWSALEADFKGALRALSMPAEATVYAKARFDRPSVWARKCPHVVDALDRRADRCRGEQRFARAVSLYGAALAIDGHDWHARLDRALVDAWFGDEERGKRELASVAGDAAAPRPWRDRAREALADGELAGGQDERAAQGYRALAADTVDEDVARTLEIKALSIGNPPGRRAMVDMLVGQPGRPIDGWLGALSLGAWAEETHEPLAAYLAGKGLALHQEYARAAQWLDRAIDSGVPTPLIGRELLRQRAICACALGDREALGRVNAMVRAPGSPFEGDGGGRSEGRREWLLRLLGRCLDHAPRPGP